MIVFYFFQILTVYVFKMLDQDGFEDCTQSATCFWWNHVMSFERKKEVEMINYSEGRCPLEPWEIINKLVHKSLANILQFMTILVGDIWSYNTDWKSYWLDT